MLRTPLLAVLSVAIGCLAAHAQNVEWIRQFGSFQAEYAHAVATDNLGNIYVGGETWGSLGAPNAGGSDFYLRKYDASGTLHWSTQVGTNFDEFSGDVSADGFGNIYLAGTWRHSFGFSKSDAWLGKYDASGTQLWSRQIGDTGAVDGGLSVATDGQGNVYFAGYTEGNLGGMNAGEADAFLSKYDSSGNLEWTGQFGTSGGDAAADIAVDGFGNVFVAGETFGSLAGANAGRSDVFLSKFDPDGTQLWTQQLGSQESDWPVSISTGEPGNVYMTGYTAGDLGGMNAGDRDAFLSKYDSSGNLRWTRQFGSDLRDGGHGVHADGLGNVFVSGHTDASQIAMGDAVFLSKFDASGSLEWTEELGTNANESSGDLSADEQGHLYIVGATRGNLGGPNQGDYDGFLAKYSVAIDPDFNDDGLIDCTDIDSLVMEIVAGTHGSSFDLTSDGIVDIADLDEWRVQGGAANLPSGNPYLEADANLDGVVDGLDFMVWNANKFTSIAAWCSGDFTADGTVDEADFTLWNQNKFMSSGGVSAVPEPTTVVVLFAAVLGLAVVRRR